jgi:hypothetical protein
MPAPWTDNDNTPVGNPYDRDIFGALTMVMAGSLLVFLHRDIGLRLLVRRRFVVVGALLVGFAYIETPFDRWLAYFATAFVALAFIHYARHMTRIRQGVPEWHTFDTGQSLIFSRLPLPRWLTQIIIEPALCGALGWWLANRSNETFYFGWWIAISAGLLAIVENKIRIARRESLFELDDTFVESAHFAHRAERFTNPFSARSAKGQSGCGLFESFLRTIQMAFSPAGRRRKDQKSSNRQRRQ